MSDKITAEDIEKMWALMPPGPAIHLPPGTLAQFDQPTLTPGWWYRESPDGRWTKLSCFARLYLDVFGMREGEAVVHVEGEGK